MHTVVALGTAADLEGALRVLISGVAALTGAESGGVRLLVDPAQPGGPARLLFWRGGDDFTWLHIDAVPGSNTARVIASGRAEYTPDLLPDAARGDGPAQIAYMRDGLRSSLIVPLRAAGRTIGTVHADSKRPNAFRTPQLGPLQLLADYAAGSVEQARLREQAAERLQRLEIAQRVSTAVNAAGDLDSMLQRVLEEAAALFGARRGMVALVDTDRQFVRGRVGFHQPPGLIEATVRAVYSAPHPDEDIYSVVVRTGEQLIIADDHPALHRKTKEQFGLHDWQRVLTPIRHAEEVIGIITLSWRHGDQPSADNLALLRLIAEQAGGASARARLGEAEAAADRRQRKLAKEMATTLVEVAAAAGPEAALEALLRGAVGLLRGDAGVGRLFDVRTGECTLLLRLRPEGALDHVRERHQLEAGSVGAALQAGGAAVIVDDFTAFDPERYGYAEVMRSQGLRSAVNVPIDAGGQRIGSLHINHRSARYFGPTDLAMASALAAQAGTVIERQAAELAVRASEERLQLVARATNDAVWDWDLGSNALWWNQGIQVLFGYRPEQVPSTLAFWSDKLHPDDAERVLKGLEAVIEGGGEFWSDEYRFRRAGGSYATILDRGYVLRDNAGAPTRMVGAMLDITARRVAEEALAQRYREAEEARGEARAVLDATEEAMILVGPDGRIASVNRRCAEIFGLDEPGPVGLEADGEAVHAYITRVFGNSRDEECLAMHLAGQEQAVPCDLKQRWPVERDLALSCRLVAAADGTPLGRLFAFRDVTRERALGRLKDEFVSHVSHELRTPLTSIKGYSDLLLSGEVGNLSDEQREFLEIIKQNADREVALVNDLLDLSRIEAGKVELTRAPLDLCALLEGTSVSFRPQLAAKQQALTTDLPPVLPSILGDINRLAQVFTNLLSNAHKYTPHGGRITIAATVADDRVRVTVTDSGIGMSVAEQEQLFTSFFRAKNRTTSEVGGTGLGLAITKSLVELHGGAISVTSAPDTGSCFTVDLPVHGA